MTVLLEARGVSKSFGGVRAVRDISLAIPEKSVFALIGPNGAGKSTLLNLLSGIYQPDAGALSFAGEDLIGLPAHRRVRLGIARTFQKIRLFKQLTVLENVLAGFHIHHEIPAWQYLVPEAFNIVESFTMMAMVIVGGMGTMIGPVIGAVVLTFLPELLRSVGELRLLVYGVALTLVVLFMPGGLVQIGAALRRRAA